MDQGPGGGCQHVHKRQHDRREVYAHRQSDAGLDGPDRGVGEPFQIRDFREVVAHEGDFRGIDGYVASHTSHGDAYVGRFLMVAMGAECVQGDCLDRTDLCRAMEGCDSVLCIPPAFSFQETMVAQAVTDAADDRAVYRTGVPQQFQYSYLASWPETGLD